MGSKKGILRHFEKFNNFKIERSINGKLNKKNGKNFCFKFLKI